MSDVERTKDVTVEQLERMLNEANQRTDTALRENVIEAQRMQEFRRRLQDFEARWTETPPTVQGYYFWWNGDPDIGPYGLYVLFSGTAQKCFVQAKDMVGAPFCDEMGGWWYKIPLPSVPVARESGDDAE